MCALLDRRLTSPVIADRRIVVGDASLLGWVIRARCHVEEVRRLTTNGTAPMRDPCRNLEHSGRQVIAEVEFLGDAMRGRIRSAVVETYQEAPGGNVPPVDLCLVDVPRLDHTGVHL